MGQSPIQGLRASPTLEGSSVVFDYEKLIEKYEISRKEANRIIDEIKNEFPDDEMMMEIHLIRALKSYASLFSKAG